MPKISLEGLDKAKVLAALYDHSKPQGMGYIHFNPAPLGLDEARELIESGGRFDYLHGRVLKVDLRGDDFDPWLYDRDNGEGAAARAVASIA